MILNDYWEGRQCDWFKGDTGLGLVLEFIAHSGPSTASHEHQLASPGNPSTGTAPLSVWLFTA